MAGCAETTRFIDTGCQWTKTIIASDQDTIETLRQVRDHDKTREKRCK